MRILDQKKIPYTHYEYDPEITEGTLVAAALGQEPERVFKTLVTVSARNVNYVFIIPVAETLDLKKAAKAVGEKSVSMLRQKELFPLTGIFNGGCSPVGMKAVQTVMHESFLNFSTVFISAGHVGHQISRPAADHQALNGCLQYHRINLCSNVKFIH